MTPAPVKLKRLLVGSIVYVHVIVLVVDIVSGGGTMMLAIPASGKYGI